LVDSLPLGLLVELLRALEEERIACRACTEGELTVGRGRVWVMHYKAVVAGVDPESEAEHVQMKKVEDLLCITTRSVLRQ
jgi:hypothetical protein